MFEQPLYETRRDAASQPSDDLFRNYEIKTWDMSPRLYKILGVAAIANIFALFVFAQTSLLTMKGCDSPLVGRVCQVLDTVYVASMLFGTDRDYIDAVYDKTELGDAEITYVDVTGISPPLDYPEGYFQLANPDQQLAMLDSAVNDFGVTSGIPGIPSGIPITPSPGGSLLDTSPTLPSQNPNSVDGSLPPEFSNPGVVAGSPNPRPKRPRRNRVVPTPKVNPTDPDTADLDQVAKVEPSPTPKAEPTDPVTGYDINKRPFVDLGMKVNDLLDKKEIKLESPFVASAAGKLTKEGKLDPKSFRWGPVSSDDQKMIEVVKGAIEAINDSGYLQYLKDLSGKDFNLMLQQDELNISAVIQSEMDNENRAKSISSGLSLLIAGAKSKKSSENADQNDKDDLVLLQNATVEHNGNRVVIKFTVPKDVALPMIQRKLAEQKAQPKTQNGNATAKPNDNTAKK